MKDLFITIEGNIGAGKTTLAHLLARRLNARLILEQFADNPFLPKFYENPAQYAFPLELFFMAERYKQMKDLVHGTRSFSDADYFRLFVHQMPRSSHGSTSRRWSSVCIRISSRSCRHRSSNLNWSIYLHAPVSKLQANIRKRNRPYEQGIPDDYLRRIQETYTQYIRQYNIRTFFVDVGNADFLGNERHFQIILDALDNPHAQGQQYLTLP